MGIYRGNVRARSERTNARRDNSYIKIYTRGNKLRTNDGDGGNDNDDTHCETHVDAKRTQKRIQIRQNTKNRNNKRDSNTARTHKKKRWATIIRHLYNFELQSGE